MTVDFGVIPVLTLMDNVITISGVNVLVVAAVTKSSVDGIGITPEVLVLVVSSVLVVTPDVFAAVVKYEIIPGVGFDEIFPCASVDVLTVALHVLATVDGIISGPTECVMVV